jgi:hypothetical protein
MLNWTRLASDLASPPSRRRDGGYSMPMTVFALDTLLAEDVPADAPAGAWRQQLEHAGVLGEVGPAVVVASAWSPASALKSIQGALSELERAESALASARAAHPLARVKVPDLAWLLIGAVLLFILLFAEVAVAALGDWAIWGGIAFAILVAAWTVVERRLQDPALRPALKAAQQAMHAAVGDLLDRSFVAVVGDHVLVNTPHLGRLRGVAEALRSAEPDAPVLPDLDGAVEAAQRQVDVLVASPVAPWSDQGIAPDTAVWLARIDQTG